MSKHSHPQQGPDVTAFTIAYVEAALWSSTDNADESGGEPLDANYGPMDIDDGTMEAIRADCADFVRRYGNLIEDDDSREISKYGEWSLAGHKFWLSRNGHGASFQDGDWPKHGDELQKAAESYGEFDLYVGDDGKVHGSPLTPRRKRLNEVAEHRDPTTGQFAAGPDPVGEWAVVQRMMKVYARKAGLGDYVHNSAIPTGKPGEWRFWAQRPGERAKEHRVSQQHLKDAYERGGLSEVDERDPRTGRFVPDHHGHGHHRRMPPRRLAPQRRGASVRDYDVTDNRGKRLAGPFKDYGTARSEADSRGGVVGFVAGELRAKTRWSDAEILSSVKHGDMMTQPAKERAYELVEAGLIDAAGTWKLTPAGERVLTNSGWENSADNPHRTKKVGCPVHGAVAAPRRNYGGGYRAEASRITSSGSSIKLTREQTRVYQEHGSAGDKLRRDVKERARELANELGRSVEVYSYDGVAFEHVRPDDGGLSERRPAPRRGHQQGDVAVTVFFGGSKEQSSRTALSIADVIEHAAGSKGRWRTSPFDGGWAMRYEWIDRGQYRTVEGAVYGQFGNAVRVTQTSVREGATTAMVAVPVGEARHYAEASRWRATRGGRHRPAPRGGHSRTISVTSTGRPDLNGTWSFTVRPYPAGDGWEWVATQNGSEAKYGSGRTKAEATEGGRQYLLHIQKIVKEADRGSPRGWKTREKRHQHSVLSRHGSKMIAAEARGQRRAREGVDAEEAGERYAEEQVQSDHFNQWVYGQMVEGRRMRKADPKSVIQLESAADYKRLARNILQQLGWDMDRDMDMRAILDVVGVDSEGTSQDSAVARDFGKGVRAVLSKPSTINSLASDLRRVETELKRAEREARGSGKRAGESRGPKLLPPAQVHASKRVQWNQVKQGNAWVTDGQEGYWAQFPRGTSAKEVLDAYMATADYDGATGTFTVTAEIEGNMASVRVGPGGEILG